MSRSVNKAILVGNVGSEPEIRTTSTGSRVAKVSLATNRSFTDSAGEEQERAEWHRLTFFGKLADVVEQWVAKGARLYVEGRIEYTTTEAEDGSTRYWTEVVVQELVMLGSLAVAERKADRPDAGDPGPLPDDGLPF